MVVLEANDGGRRFTVRVGGGLLDALTDGVYQLRVPSVDVCSSFGILERAFSFIRHGLRA